MKHLIGLVAFFLIMLGKGEAFTGAAVELNGQGAFVECQPHALPLAGGELTLNAWILAEDLGAEAQPIFSFGTGDNLGGALYLLAGGKLQLRVPVVGSIDTLLFATSDSLTVLPGVWCNIAAVFAPEQEWAGIYLNGQLAASLVGKVDPDQYTQGKLFWGGKPEGAYLKGMVDEISVWNSALVDFEILELIEGATTGTEIELVAYFPIDIADELGQLENKKEPDQSAWLRGEARVWKTQILVPPAKRSMDIAAITSPPAASKAVNQVANWGDHEAEKQDFFHSHLSFGGDDFVDWEKKWDAAPPQDWELDEDDIWVRYNRVEGAFVGWKLPKKYHRQQGVSHFGQVGYGFSNEAWRYRAGSEIYTFYPDLLGAKSFWSFGAEIYDRTASEDGWLVSEEENSLDAIFVRRDFRDYFRRSGWSIYSSHNLSGVLRFGVKVQRDEFESMQNEVDWIVRSNRFARKSFRPNPAVDENKINSWRAEIQFDSRDQPTLPANGWLINGFLERGGGILSGDRDYRRYLLDLRRHHRVGWDTRVDLRLRAGGSSGDLPIQYYYDLGGFSTLRGYGFKEFTGQRLLLGNLEYWVDSEHWRGHLPLDGINVGVFYDVGAAWFSENHPSALDNPELAEVDFKRSFGFGLKVPSLSDSFRLYLARTLDEKNETWSVSARLTRSF